MMEQSHDQSNVSKPIQWVSVFKSSNEYKAIIIKGMLLENGIPAVVLNKRDSSHMNFGLIEVLVDRNLSMKALILIGNVQ